MVEKGISHSELRKRHSWLQRARQSIAVIRNRCRITHEVRFADTFHGLYTVRFSADGEIMVVGYGTGGMQVMILLIKLRLLLKLLQ
jgi:alpha-D-ribose 1-methylphosphonate 5-phosphate C-P lyase